MGTLSAPSWRLIRNAKLAANIYAPLGTEMSLGDYVRVVRMFLEAFKVAEGSRHGDGGKGSASASDGEVEGVAKELDERIVCLGADLKVRSPSYQQLHLTKTCVSGVPRRAPQLRH